ncbi:hypothetical protein C0033_10295 [Clostridium sp. chh4-2]|uniref:helix-turn-helix domain-containing protein n=1 Tax=Clostridium sp. chh4-2 TaxID=2067550 RepID=UPI000CCDD1DF|nr:helix-turn-helix transcriptional regulator [Clostridium sp. chh4-2]PNV62034.1 hypothetical protein C0033_10295 [Clostridium sp. chh4-2]
MKLSEKVVALRKAKGMSQEGLAEKLNVSRQAVSRWEMGSALPDASNILQLSKLFGVTADYLLNDDYKNDSDLPQIKEIKEDNSKLILIFLVILEFMVLLIQFTATCVLKNVFFGFFSFIQFSVIIVGFEFGYRKKISSANETTALFRKRFYKISTWLGLYFPIRFLITILMSSYPRSYSNLVVECIVFSIYIGVSIFVTLFIEKHYLMRSKTKSM